jgi:tRNA pseudouridine55 synthase
MLTLYKKVGETPLECMENYRKEHKELESLPMTYAGRLDPMAEGLLLVLVGEECKEKDKYLGFDKEYEIEVLFGVKTDTGDVLGIIQDVKTDIIDFKEIDLSKYKGNFIQKYPIYSSKTVNGEQLHTLARRGELPDEIPTKSVEIYDIKEIGRNNIIGKDIANNSILNINKVNGDFRQKEIIEEWNNFCDKYGDVSFKVLKLKVYCSSGTYMRSLAERMAEDIGDFGIALSIKRVKIGDFV